MQLIADLPNEEPFEALDQPNLDLRPSVGNAGAMRRSIQLRFRLRRQGDTNDY